uniref:Platelet-derived growth factor (PDGF) family profile domain-containing protein n=1 Tax=Pavo cristatus TaxID=9049 RepID=A0A8C9G824_PAVCR
MQYSRGGLTRAEQRRVMTSLSLLDTSPSMHYWDNFVLCLSLVLKLIQVSADGLSALYTSLIRGLLCHNCSIKMVLFLVIDEEWQKTQCVPRETCVEVAKELGTTTNKFFKPPCVNVFRCGGCCNEESLSCMNTSTTYVSKTLFEISVPLTSVPEPVPIKIANHTGCKCLSNTQRHQYTIIRRSVQYPEEDGCPFSNKLCHNGWVWDSDKCECVSLLLKVVLAIAGLPPLAELAMCGQYMEFDEENCECICRQKCPTDFFQSKENCSCYLCRESQESCAQKHKIFHAETCSCEDRCPSQPRTCPTAKPTCPRHCRCPKEKRNSHGSQSKENP